MASSSALEGLDTDFFQPSEQSGKGIYFPFFVSSLIHGLFLFLLFFVRWDRAVVHEEPVYQAVWLSTPHSMGVGEKRTSSKLNLGLVPKTSVGPDSRKFFPGGSGEKEAMDAYEVANRMGVEREGKLFPFFELLWRKVNSQMVYPDSFIDQRIHGKVTVQIVVNRLGIFTGEILSIHGEDSLLQTLVFSILVHALKEPLSEAQAMKEERIPLVFEFDFNLLGVGQLPRRLEHAHVKNVLYFRRDAHIDPKLNQVIEKIFTKYIPPIIVIPGGFYIDFIRAYSYVKNLVVTDFDQDRRKEERFELQKEELERFIKKSP